MEDLKIKVADEDSAIESRDLFRNLGFTPDNSKYGQYVNWVAVFNDGSGSFFTTDTNLEECKEVTISELKDIVVLKRNEPDDANFENKVTGIKYFVSSAGDIYFWCGDWQKCHASFRIEKLNPIKEDVMKEYLFKYNDQYTLVELSKEDAQSNPEQYIEVPDGAEIYTKHETDEEVFYKKGLCFLDHWDGKWLPTKYLTGGFVAEMKCLGRSVLWQREKESISDQVVTGEVARQELKGIDATLAERRSQYGCFEDVARTTEQIMEAMAKVRVNGLKELPYPHRMALYMIASKMSRIVNGDFNHKDSWHDIGGYSKLIEDLIGDNNEI